MSLKYHLVAMRAKKHVKTRQEKTKLNIGCGTDYKEGWVNIDNNSDKNITQLDLNWDLRNPLPFDDNSVDFIFNEHFIEHLSVEESRKSLSDFMRVLKPGGVMRIAMPDMVDVIDLYRDKNWRNRPVIKNHGLDFVQTRAELVNMSFSWWGHKWLYDWEELSRRLKEVGCGSFSRCQTGESKYKELINLETREGSTLVAEIIK